MSLLTISIFIVVTGKFYNPYSINQESRFCISTETISSISAGGMHALTLMA